MGADELHSYYCAFSDKRQAVKNQRPGHFVVPSTPPALEARHEHFLKMLAGITAELDRAICAVPTNTDEDKDAIYAVVLRMRYVRTLVVDVTNEIQALQDKARKGFEVAQLKNEAQRLRALAELSAMMKLCERELAARGVPQVGRSALPDVWPAIDPARWSNALIDQYRKQVMSVGSTTARGKSPQQPMPTEGAASDLFAIAKKDPALWDRIKGLLKK